MKSLLLLTFFLAACSSQAKPAAARIDKAENFWCAEGAVIDSYGQSWYYEGSRCFIAKDRCLVETSKMISEGYLQNEDCVATRYKVDAWCTVRETAWCIVVSDVGEYCFDNLGHCDLAWQLLDGTLELMGYCVETNGMDYHNVR